MSQSVASASLCSGGGCDKKTGNGRRNSERIQETHDVTWQAEAVIPLFFCGGGSALHVQSIGIAVYYLRLREHWINIAGFFALRQWVRCHFPGIVPAGYFRWWRCIKKTSPGSVRSGDFAPVFSSRTDEACIPCHPKRWRPSIDGFGDASDRISFSGPVAHPDRALAF